MLLQDLLSETRLPNKSMKIPTSGTTKNPAYCNTELYQPAVMLSVLNLCSANSVAFCVKITAVLVSLCRVNICMPKSGVHIQPREGNNCPKYPWQLDNLLDLKFLVLFRQLLTGGRIGNVDEALMGVSGKEVEHQGNDIRKKVHKD